MGLFGIAKKLYGKVDAGLFGGRLPGGATPGMPYISVGDNASNVPQGTSSFNGNPNLGSYGGSSFNLDTGGPGNGIGIQPGRTGGIGVQPSPAPTFGGGWQMPQTDSSSGNGGHWYSGITNWLSGNGGDNAKYALAAIGTGVNAYEDYKNRQATGQQNAVDNAARQQEIDINRQQEQLNALTAQRNYEADIADRMKHQAAIRQIIQMNQTDANGGNARGGA